MIKITEYLAKDGTYGGAETIKVASQILKVNIVVFNESEKCRFYFDFNSKYERTIVIAYRLKQLADESSWNNYDSIAGVGEHIIFEAAVALAKIEMDRCSLNKEGEIFVDLLTN